LAKRVLARRRCCTQRSRLKRADVTCVCVNNPTLTWGFVELLARRFSLSTHARESKTALLAELEATLERRLRGEIGARGG
jgi:hypothetical protein